MDGWNTDFLLGRPIFKCELLVLGRIYTLVLQFDCCECSCDFEGLKSRPFTIGQFPSHMLSASRAAERFLQKFPMCFLKRLGLHPRCMQPTNPLIGISAQSQKNGTFSMYLLLSY